MAADDLGKSRVVPEADGGLPTVVLPCPPDKFSEFIAGLLGRPQTIETIVEGPFVVRKDDAVNLYHLIDQRLASQNEANLVQFTARIVYDDDSSVLLNSLQDFVAYNEVKPLKSTALHLSWTYLIQFRLKSFPEKQVIQVSFNIEDRFLMSSNKSFARFISAEGSAMTIRIEHTDRTWGTDIEALFTGQLKTLQTPISKIRRFTNKYSGSIGVTTGGVALFISTLLAYQIQKYFAIQMASQMPVLKGPATIDFVAQQLGFLAELVATGRWNRFSLLIVVFGIATLVGAVVLGTKVSDVADQPPQSFVLLSASATAAYGRYNRSIEKSWWRLAGWIIATLALGVASNAIFFAGLKFFGGDQ